MTKVFGNHFRKDERPAHDVAGKSGHAATVQAFYLVADNPLDRFFRDLIAV